MLEQAQLVEILGNIPNELSYGVANMVAKGWWKVLKPLSAGVAVMEKKKRRQL